MATGKAEFSEQVETLYNDHHGWLFGWLRRRLGDSYTAADLTQDTFLRVYTKSRSEVLSNLLEPRAYLSTVAKRLLVNHYERQSLERAFLDTLAAVPEQLAPSVEERALVLETLHEIDALLDKLPANVRSAFLMSQLESLSYDEIAVRLNVNVRTVTRYMAQAFRQCLHLMIYA